MDTEEEAEEILVLACGTNLSGEYFARELAEEQTLKNLQLFSDKVAKCHAIIKRARARRGEKNDAKEE